VHGETQRRPARNEGDIVNSAHTARELLELAAKAADIKLAWDARGAFEVRDGIDGNDTLWNPQADDGDALRLAAACRITIHFWDDGNTVSTAKSLPDGDDPPNDSDAWTSAEARDFGGLSGAARHAIVWTAAEIGKAMP
jgi:hypothetical protein